jgi:archaellum component FlaC
MEDKKVRVILEEIRSQFKVFGEGLKGINEKLDSTIEMTAKNSEDIEMVKIDVKEIKDDILDAGYTIERIETKIDASIRKQGDLSVRTKQLQRKVLVLEAKKT